MLISRLKEERKGTKKKKTHDHKNKWKPGLEKGETDNSQERARAAPQHESTVVLRYNRQYFTNGKEVKRPCYSMA